MAGPLEIFNAAGNKLRPKIKICMQIYGFVVQTGQKFCVNGVAVSARPCARTPPKGGWAHSHAPRARARTV